MRLMRAAAFLLVLLISLFAAGAGGASSSAAAPWEVWRDLRALAVLDPSSRLLLRSSHCPTGCASDKHGPGESRFLRVAGGEGVIFEANGPGAITRLWMTTGTTVSAPLPATARIRFYFDGEAAPRLDLALPELFDGSRAPFRPPLVADRLTSSGGFISYVPLPYRQGCRVTLSGADELRLWFQLTHHRLPAGASVTTFTGAEDLSAWAALLASPGEDPWPDGSSGRRILGQRTLEPGASARIFSAAAPGVVTQLRLALPAARRSDLRVTLRFDGETTVDLPAAELFAAGSGDALPTRSALVGVDSEGGLYSWFPLPFFASAAIELTNRGATPLTVETSVRLHREGPLPGSGRFAAVAAGADPLPLTEPWLFLGLDRPGRWVGLAARLGAVDGVGRRYLEGDERIFVDGSLEPELHGTGVEDFFGGGFYFDQGPFRRSLHGMSAQVSNDRGEDETAAYRLMLTDSVSFSGRLRARLEAGPTGSEPMRARMVAWVYVGKPRPDRSGLLE